MSNPTNDFKSDPTIINNQFANEKAIAHLRVCCYGSSSAKTPTPFLKEAWTLGYFLAKRGHTCVNGAGSFGCMAAMNDGAHAGDGHIVGVIHEMFLVDGNDFIDRDGGAHNVFRGTGREILVAGGDDLQERKKLLVEGADALIVLPGGPGTWDELWEMACARNLGLSSLPIVCISVNGFYDSFQEMLARAYAEGLVKNKPEDVVHFVPTAEEAIRWIELQKQQSQGKPVPRIKTRASVLKKSSFFSPPLIARSISWLSWDGDGESVASVSEFLQLYKGTLIVGTMAFVAGAAIGIVAGRQQRK